jgi:phosphatidylinositol kinase/protein kinase (PI-3  family)
MEEDLLVGDPCGQNDSLRPLAYSLLAELIHHMRMQLNIKQLHRIIFIFSRILHDSSLTYSVHVTCVRLLLNLVESIYHQRNDPVNARDGRLLLGRILDTFTDKFGTLNTKADNFKVSILEEMKKNSKDSKSIKAYSEKRKARYEYIQLLRTLIMGMKALLWSMTNYAQIRKQKGHTVHPVSPLSEYEVVSVSKLVANGFSSLSVLRENELGSVSDHFASMCQVVDPKNITEVFARHITTLFDKALKFPALVQVLAQLLLNNETHAPFADVLSSFLIGRKLDALGKADSDEGKLVARLLKHLLRCLGKYHSCEFYMKNRLVPLVQGCLDRAVKTVHCTPYIEILNLLFHSLAGGKLDKLYQEFLFILQPTIDSILMILQGPAGKTHRKQIVELCLTLPVRLQNLLPYLSKLMKPILIALKGQDELVNMGLRTLEFWVDSLNPEFLEQEMASIEVELMQTLWSHLQPPPYPFGARTLQLLGKLGGRNRRFLSKPLPLEFKSNPEYGLRVILSFQPQTRFLIPLDKCIQMATNVVRNRRNKHYATSAYYNTQAASFLQSCLISLLNLRENANEVSKEMLISLLLGEDKNKMVESEAKGGKEEEANPTGGPKPEMTEGNPAVAQAPKTKLQFSAEQKQFTTLVTSVIIISHQQDSPKKTKSGLDTFVTHMCDHFVLMLIAQKDVEVKAGDSDQFRKLDPSLFFDAIIATICDGTTDFSEIGLKVVEHMLSSFKKVKEDERLSQVKDRLTSRVVGMTELFMSKLVHHCFKLPSLDHPNLMKAINLVYSEVPSEKKIQHIPAILKALFFVLRNLPCHSLEDCRQVKFWIKKYLSEELRNAKVLGESKDKEVAMKQIIESTVNEALNANAGKIANECAFEVLQICSDILQKPVSAILEPVSKRLLVSILHKPLNSRKLEVQIQALSIATYCINLGPSIIASLTPELMRLVVEAMNICNADQAQLPPIKSSDKCNVTYTDLKAASIKFLWAALTLKQLDTAGQTGLKTKVIPLMFKLLAHPNESVVSAALDGLSDMIKNQGIPKDLLQQSLRPILLHLQRHSHLRYPLLKGIAKLLELLSHHFNTTLGEKLVNHLKKWLDPEKLATSRHDYEETKLAAAIIEQFHLLPSQASKFLESTPERPGLVVLTIQLEAHMGIGAPNLEMISPYREPLTKYLNRYADTAIDYFLVRMSNPSYFVRFLDLISSEEGKPLREKLASSTDKIIKYCFTKDKDGEKKGLETENNNETGSTTNAAKASSTTPTAGTPTGTGKKEAAPKEPPNTAFEGVKLVSVLSDLNPGWIVGCEDLIEVLKERWNSPERKQRISSEEKLPPMQVKESKWLVKCFMHYIRAKKLESTQLIFSLLTSFTSKTRVDFTFLRNFLSDEIVEIFSTEEKKALMESFFSHFKAKEEPPEFFAGLEVMVFPIFEKESSGDSNSKVIDEKLLSCIVKDYLGTVDTMESSRSELHRIAMLKLATSLIKHNSKELVAHRKELIKFGWNHLKREDSTSKFYAFVNVCYFLNAYQAPEKIILQVFVALLRTWQVEARPFVNEALDILMPALPHRLQEDNQQQKVPIWNRYVKKILIEEGHIITHTIHLWHLIVRHDKMFYSNRAQFVPQMINSLPKLGLLPNSSLENRNLALELALLILKWEEKSIAQEAGQGVDTKMKIDSSAAPEADEKTEDANSKKRSKPEDTEKADASDKKDGNAAGESASKMEVDSKEGKEPAAKQMKLGDSSAKATSDKPKAEAGATGTDIVPATPSSAQKSSGRQEFRLSSAMQEMLVNFIIRFSFLCGESSDRVNLYHSTMDALTKSIKMWPNVTVKIHYLHRLLQSNVARQQDPTPALVAGLEVMRKVADAQDGDFLKSNSNLIIMITELTFNSKRVPISSNYVYIIKKLFSKYYPAQPGNTDVQKLFQHLHDLITKHLSACEKSVHGDNIGNGHSSCVSVALKILLELSEEFPQYVETFTPGLIKVFKKHVQECSTEQTSGKQKKMPARTDSQMKKDMAKPSSNMCLILKILSVERISNAETKKTLLHTLIQLITLKGHTEEMYMELSRTVCKWVSLPLGHTNEVTARETILFMQRLASLERNGNISARISSDWQELYLKTLYHLCTNPAQTDKAKEIRRDAFNKVESWCLIGLRARSISWRHAFFDLHCKNIGKTPYECLQYIFHAQDWESLSNTFWLNVCVSLLLKIVDGKPFPTLAPNSSQLPSLLPIEENAAATTEQADNTIANKSAQPGKDNKTIEAAKQPRIASTQSIAAADQKDGEGKEQQALDKSAQAKAGTEAKPAEKLATDGVKTAEEKQKEEEKPTEEQKVPKEKPVAQKQEDKTAAVQQQEKETVATGKTTAEKKDATAAAEGDKPEKEKTAVVEKAAAEGQSEEKVAMEVDDAKDNQAAPKEDESATKTVVPEVKSDAAATKPEEKDASDAKAMDVDKVQGEQQQAPEIKTEANAAQTTTTAAKSSEVKAKSALEPAKGDATAVTQSAQKPETQEEIKMLTFNEEVADNPDLFERHASFLTSVAKVKMQNLVVPLQELAYNDPNLSYHLWVLLFPIVWATLTDVEKKALARPTGPIVSLLSKDYHIVQAPLRPNVIQALLEGFIVSQPLPKLPMELVKYLGKTYNAWHVAIKLLESYLPRVEDKDRCLDALAELYQLLNEEDIYLGLWKRRCLTEETRIGLSYVQHGKHTQAQEVFLQAMAKVRSGAISKLPKREIVLWEQQWISCAKELNQWQQLSEFAQKVEHYSLLVDCLWKVSDWHTLKDRVLSRVQMEDTPKVMMVQGYLHLHEGQVIEGDQCINHGIRRALHKWWQLPSVGEMSHVPLLSLFQQLVELQESTRVLLELGMVQQQQQQHSYSELKDILETWRLRTPNFWDSLGQWHDLFQWRNHIHNIVISAFKTFQDQPHHMHQIGYRDKAWSINKLACIARKQNLHSLSLDVLKTLYGYYQMEVQEAFVKIREQVLACLSIPGELVSALNLINTTNLEFFPQQHKAEMFRLKASIFQKLNNSEQAHSNFSTSLSIDPGLAEGWYSWGSYCEDVYEAHGNITYLEYAASCYLQAIKIDTKLAKKLMSKFLLWLSFDNTSSGDIVGRVFDKYGEGVPTSVWLPYVSQLICSLQRPEAARAKALLFLLVQSFPQCVYYSLRTFLLDRREGSPLSRNQFASRSSQQAGDSSKGQQKQRGAARDWGFGHIPTVSEAFAAGKQVMEVLRSEWALMIHELETFIHEIGTKFVPTPEERLLAVVHALLQRCYKYSNAPLSSEVPSMLKRELAQICKACFSKETVTKHEAFVKQYKDDFWKDLNPDEEQPKDAKESKPNPNFPKSLGELTQSLKVWKARLENSIAKKGCNVLKLEKESTALQHMVFENIEIPGYRQSRQISTQEEPVFVEGVLSDIEIVQRYGSSHRRITLLGSNGEKFTFLIQSGLGPSTSCDERVMSLLHAFNTVLEVNSETRRRATKFFTPAIISLWPQITLVEDHESFLSFIEVYEWFCSRFGREPDAPIMRFKEIVSAALNMHAPEGQMQLTPQAILEIRYRAFGEISTQIVADNIFAQYMYKVLPSCSHLWEFKKRFATQLGLSSVLSYALQVGSRSPNKIIFSRASGAIFNSDFFPMFDSNGNVECTEPVPFRLTRNIQVLLTPFCLEGIFVTTMASCAQAINTEHSLILPHLGLFFRDELLNWSWRRLRSPGPTPMDLKTMVKSNVANTINRMKAMKPTEKINSKTNVSSQHLQKGAYDLVERAVNPECLCRMEPTWHPWF